MIGKLKEKGITLIALVVTIIILLILAGVTLNIALSENGLIKKSKEAVDKQKISEYLERVELARSEVALENLGEVTIDELMKKIVSNGIVTEGQIIKLDDKRAKMETDEKYVFAITTEASEYMGQGEEYEIPPEIKEGEITYKISPEGPTNGKLTVTIEKTKEDIYYLQYSLDNESWQDYKDKIEVEKNGKIYLRRRNNNEEKGAAIKCK